VPPLRMKVHANKTSRVTLVECHGDCPHAQKLQRLVRRLVASLKHTQQELADVKGQEIPSGIKSPLPLSPMEPGNIQDSEQITPESTISCEDSKSDTGSSDMSHLSVSAVQPEILCILIIHGLRIGCRTRTMNIPKHGIEGW
jgi:hypothetical protein